MTNYSESFTKSVQNPYFSKQSDKEIVGDDTRFILELYNYVSWVEKSLMFLDDIGNIGKEILKKDVSFEVNFEVYREFEFSFKKEIKPALNKLFNNILREPLEHKELLKFKKLISLIKKPFEEIRNYPLNKLDDKEFDEWFASLVSALENSIHKLMKYTKKMGFNIEAVSQVNVEISKTDLGKEPVNYENKASYYHHPNLGGKTPSSIVTAA